MAGGFAAATGLTIFGATYTGLAAFSIGAGASLAMSAVSTVLSPKPKPLQASTALSSSLTQQVRQPISSRKIIYGGARTSGPITYIATSSTSDTVDVPATLTLKTWSTSSKTAKENQMLHIVIPVAAHEVEAIDAVWLNDVPIQTDMLDAGGYVNSGDYSGKVRIKKHLGTTTQAADADLLAEQTTLTSDFRGRGVAYVYGRYQFEQDLFSSGLPNLSAYVRGRKIYDPRDGQTRWSPNPALVWRDYMTASFGLAAQTSEVDDTAVQTAADACDELVDTKDLARTASLVDATNNWVEFDADSLLFEIGDVVRVSSTSSVPGGLSAGVDYYAVPAHYSGTPAVKFATSYANALAGTTVDITSTGSGTITVTKTMEPRYTCNGIVDTDNTPVDILSDLLSSMGGRAIYVGGKWTVLAGVWRPASAAFDADDLTGEVVTQTRHSRRELFNALKGSYISSANLNQPTEYPAVANSTWEAQDGERIFNQLDLPFTNRAQTAQRIAKIELERHRRQISCDISLNMTGMLATAGDTVSLTFANNGWAAKTFEVVSWQLNVAGGQEGEMPVFGVNLSLREVDQACFDFDETTEEVQPNPSPTTNLPDPFNVVAPTSLTLQSGTAYLDRRLDGTVFSRIYASWTASTDSLVSRYEVQYKKSSSSDWSQSVLVAPDITYYSILDVRDGVSYDVRVRGVNVVGRVSAWLTSTGHVVIGKTEPPSIVPSLVAQQNGKAVVLRWSAVTDPDVKTYELRYMAAPFNWDAATPIESGGISRASRATSFSLPVGTWTIGIKALDTSGNYSTTATTVQFTVTDSDSELVFSSQQAPTWLGTLTNLVRHDVSGTLIPESTDSDATADDVMDEFVVRPETTCTYEAAEIDLGQDGNGIRVYAETTAVAGPGEAAGSTLTLQVDYRTQAGSYDGFEDWTVDTVEARYIKEKITLDTTDGVSVVSSFTPLLDAIAHTEGEQGVTVSMGGYTFVYDQPFYSLPNLQITPTGSNTRIPVLSASSTTGFTVALHDLSDVDQGGTMNWTATGP